MKARIPTAIRIPAIDLRLFTVKSKGETGLY